MGLYLRFLNLLVFLFLIAFYIFNSQGAALFHTFYKAEPSGEQQIPQNMKLDFPHAENPFVFKVSVTTAKY